jgi:tetratricopeptide (TPR) repeat protein
LEKRQPQLLSKRRGSKNFWIMKKNIKITVLLIFSLAWMQTRSQEKDQFLPKANKEFANKNYVDAEANYRISDSKFPKKGMASYNLGNTIYTINQPAEAGLAYLKSISESKTYTQKHKAYHNLGNTCMKVKDYTNAVAAYKNALINNPNDEQTRYNYALAKKMLKDNPPPKDNKKDKDKKDKDKKDKDKKDKDKKQDENKDGDKDKDKNDQNKDGDKPKEDKPKDGQPKPNPGGISKERLQNLLDAVNNEEKKVQDKVNKNKVKGKAARTDKDW